MRIIRACKEMGISTVAVFSEADREALHVSLADESYCIGPAPVGGELPEHGGHHLGGHLLGGRRPSTQATVCSRRTRALPHCVRSATSPSSARAPRRLPRPATRTRPERRCAPRGVPVIPGCDAVSSVEEAKEQAKQIGFPLLIKARAGGGGRGIRLVKEESELEAAYLNASREALSAFGDGGVYMEKYLYPAKHIEMQILCDNYGNVVCLGERECSIQRKNQKLIEECPSNALDAPTRQRMIEVAAKAAKAVNYRNAGTVEFLYKDGQFYFMEMNTRLQVEHTVTEMVTGLDLVKWQIRIAAGQKLGFSQEDIRLDGHAIECRINAENPEQNFRPSCGRITLLHIPGGPWVRFDTALYQDYFVPPYYDSMIGKLIVYAKTREEAIRKLQAALCELVIEGVDHNSQLHMELLSDSEFKSGDYYTDFMAKKGY